MCRSFQIVSIIVPVHADIMLSYVVSETLFGLEHTYIHTETSLLHAVSVVF